MQTRTSKLISKYEKQIEELTRQCTMKSDECYMAWSSVECANLELGRLKIELHQKGAVMESLGMYYSLQQSSSMLIVCIYMLIIFMLCLQSKHLVERVTN